MWCLLHLLSVWFSLSSDTYAYYRYETANLMLLNGSFSNLLVDDSQPNLNFDQSQAKKTTSRSTKYLVERKTDHSSGRERRGKRDTNHQAKQREESELYNTEYQQKLFFHANQLLHDTMAVFGFVEHH